MNIKSTTIISVTLAILGIVTPIAWDRWSNSHELSLFVSQRTLLIERNEKVEGLHVTLGDREVSKLYSTQLKLENTGRKAINKEDVLKPVAIDFSPADVLNITLVNRSPDNLEYSVKNIASSGFEIAFDLLNRSDSITINVLTEVAPQMVKGTARIKDIAKLNVYDRDEEASKTVKMPFHVLYMSGFSILILLGSVYGIRKVFGPIRSAAYQAKDMITLGFNKETLLLHLQKNLWPEFSEAERERINSRIDKTDINNAEEVASLGESLLYEGLNKDASGGLAIAALISGLGLLYSVIRVVIALVAS